MPYPDAFEPHLRHIAQVLGWQTCKMTVYEFTAPPGDLRVRVVPVGAKGAAIVEQIAWFKVSGDKFTPVAAPQADE